MCPYLPTAHLHSVYLRYVTLWLQEKALYISIPDLQKDPVKKGLPNTDINLLFIF